MLWSKDNVILNIKKKNTDYLLKDIFYYFYVTLNMINIYYNCVGTLNNNNNNIL